MYTNRTSNPATFYQDVAYARTRGTPIRTLYDASRSHSRSQNHTHNHDRYNTPTNTNTASFTHNNNNNNNNHTRTRHWTSSSPPSNSNSNTPANLSDMIAIAESDGKRTVAQLEKSVRAFRDEFELRLGEVVKLRRRGDLASARETVEGLNAKVDEVRERFRGLEMVG